MRTTTELQDRVLLRVAAKKGAIYTLSASQTTTTTKTPSLSIANIKNSFGGEKRKQIGYLSRDRAEKLHEEIEEGQVVSKIIEVTGSWWDLQGVNIELKVHTSEGN